MTPMIIGLLTFFYAINQFFFGAGEEDKYCHSFLLSCSALLYFPKGGFAVRQVSRSLSHTLSQCFVRVPFKLLDLASPLTDGRSIWR